MNIIITNGTVIGWFDLLKALFNIKEISKLQQFKTTCFYLIIVCKDIIPK